MSAALPDNPLVQNNVAAISMLLKTHLTEAHEAARQAYAKLPEIPSIAATYAYSLHLQGRTKEGLTALEKLKSQDLAQPSVALYYGLLLRADNQTAKAAQYLALTRDAPLLPEEKALAAAALN